MSGPKLGELITTNEARDAIHIAVLPVTAGEDLAPSAWVRFAIAGNTEIVVSCKAKDAVGIIDPFLHKGVNQDEHCWMFMLPNTITSLRHEWEHPQVDGTDTKALAEWWLRDFCAKEGLNYDYVVDSFATSDYCNVGDNEFFVDEPEYSLLKKNLSIVVGREVKQPYFSCAC